MDFAHTRQENDDKLLARLDAIRQGQDLEVLEPFARAYLGLYYDIDNHVPPAERIDLLANPTLAEGIRAGFVASLQRTDLPACTEIAIQNHAQQTLPIAYVVLAGMDLLTQDSSQEVLSLSDASLQAALCFHLTTSTFHHNVWYTRLLIEKPKLAGAALLAMWQQLIQQQVSFMPGLHDIIKAEVYKHLLAYVLVPLLRQWQRCRAKDLAVLLSRALRDAAQEDLANVVRETLQDMDKLPIRNRVYWMATGFILEPDIYGQELVNFTGQEKIKLLPLLDFSMAVLTAETRPIDLSAMGYAYLIRCLAPRFTPQEDGYGNLGEITMKVLWLFYQLACFDDEQGRQALLWLQTVRVLKLYKDVFKHMAGIQQTDNRPDFIAFVAQLREKGHLRMKKKWSDVR